MDPGWSAPVAAVTPTRAARTAFGIYPAPSVSAAPVHCAPRCLIADGTLRPFTACSAAST